jgi:hypothetical protein
VWIWLPGAIILIITFPFDQKFTSLQRKIKRDYNKKSERYWDDEIYHQRSAKKSRIIEEMKNVAETYKICIYWFSINLLTGMQKHTK